jgi:peptidoglycan-N-acetylglucosamine deacetylase
LAAGAAVLASTSIVIVAAIASASTTTYQAEASANTRTGGANVKSCTGCAGQKKIGNVGNNSGTLRFNGITAASAGQAKITIRYVNGGTKSRTATLSVNGGTPTTTTYPPTADWQTPGTLTLMATLKAGDNTLTFANPVAGSYAPDFDEITVVTADPTTDSYGRIPTTDALVEVTTTKPEVAITFDDGPWTYSGPGTPKFLDLVKSKGAHVTFFTIGLQVADLPTAVSREVAEGHQVGNHTWTHADMTTLDAASRQTQWTQTTAAIKAASGQSPKVWRPPYGSTNATINKESRALGMAPVLWNIDSEDWKLPGVSTIVTNVMSQIHPGSIVLMHDGGGDRTQTYQAATQILDQLAARGLAVVTIEQLLRDGTPVTEPTLDGTAVARPL